MKINELFLEELKRDAALSRRVLERVPEGHNLWRPHEKSMPLGYLSALVATMPAWIDMIVNSNQFDIAQKNTEYSPKDIQTSSGLVALLDGSVEKARKALESTTDEHLLKPWKLLAHGHLVKETPRHVQIRDGVLSHLAHHRGQLTVYLRLNEATVPGIYGPSADEPFVPK
ncbi:MAG TPA: DinB family protein [Pseudacidobacterium sp.]|jgi:uncharacterized damage-inducible protein DinB|nr:DinB family protein [Pseudacidobacterium sp.]